MRFVDVELLARKLTVCIHNHYRLEIHWIRVIDTKRTYLKTDKLFVPICLPSTPMPSPNKLYTSFQCAILSQSNLSRSYWLEFDLVPCTRSHQQKIGFSGFSEDQTGIKTHSSALELMTLRLSFSSLMLLSRLNACLDSGSTGLFTSNSKVLRWSSPVGNALL